MVREKYSLRLSPKEQEGLQHLVRAGESSVRATNRVRILLKTGERWSAPRVVEALDLAESTVYRTKRRFAEEGLAGALKDRPQAHRYRKLDDRGEAHLIALACSPAPSLFHEAVRQRFKKRLSNPGRRRSGASPR